MEMTAVDVRAVLHPLVEGGSVPPIDELRRRAGIRRRHRRLRLAGLGVVVALLGLGLSLSLDRGDAPVSVAADGQVPYVPPGWQAVTYGKLQFAVPADWPVQWYEAPCAAASGVYLGVGQSRPGASCSYSAPMPVVALYPTHPRFTFDAGSVERTVNGLRIEVSSTTGGTGAHLGSIGILVPSFDVLINLDNFASTEQLALADEIVETIGAAPEPQPYRPPPKEATATPAPPSPYCQAIEAYRSSVAGAEGTRPNTGDLERFERILTVAPPEVEPAIRAMTEWLRAGAPEPAPNQAEVDAAGVAATQHWAKNCQGVG